MPAGRVQAVGRLVEQQQLRIVHQRGGQLQPLQVAGRVFFQPAIAQLAQADVVEHLVGAAAGVAMRHAVQVAGEGDELDALEHRHDGGGLGHVADAAAQLGRCRGGCRSPGSCRRPSSGSSNPSSTFSSVDLPAPLLPTSPIVPGGQRQVHVAQGLHAAEAAADVMDVDQLHGVEQFGRIAIRKLTPPR